MRISFFIRKNKEREKKALLFINRLRILNDNIYVFFSYYRL